MNGYQYRHLVCFDETSLVGSVYFARYLDWQGRCRERFLCEHAPAVVESIKRRELALITLSCSCDYQAGADLTAGEEVTLRMRLTQFRGARMSLSFDYERDGQQVASGEQRIACKVRSGDEWIARPFPTPLVEALRDFTDDPEILAALADALAFHSA